jgi:polyhydroxyalkanoate synthase subunit PhaC
MKRGHATPAFPIEGELGEHSLLILHGRITEQVIDRGERGKFRKEILVTPGSVPLAIVRKRWAGAPQEKWHPSPGRGRAGAQPVVLLIHGFGQNRYAWHLPSRSLANHFARAGFDVFNLDLRGHGRSRALGGKKSLGVFDYVDEDLPAAVREVQRHVGERRVFLVGHSLGGLVSYAAAPALNGSVAGIVTIGSPYHFTRGSPSLTVMGYVLGAVARSRGVPRGVPIHLAPWGMLLNATRRFAESSFNPIPVRGWSAGGLEPHVLAEHLGLAFDRAGVGEMLDMFEWAADRRFFGVASDYSERFERLDVPLLVVAGASDDLAPPPSVRPGFSQSRSTDKRYEVVPSGTSISSSVATLRSSHGRSCLVGSRSARPKINVDMEGDRKV